MILLEYISPGKRRNNQEESRREGWRVNRRRLGYGGGCQEGNWLCNHGTKPLEIHISYILRLMMVWYSKKGKTSLWTITDGPKTSFQGMVGGKVQS